MTDEFRRLYGAYEYLASAACDGIESATRGVIDSVRRGDADAAARCVAKMAEERAEVEGVLAGTHSHAGLSLREMMLNELQQSLYWAFVVAVGQGMTADEAFASPPVNEAMEFAADRVAAFNRAYPSVAITMSEVALADLAQMQAKPYLSGYVP